MREYSSPALVQDPISNLTEFITRNAAEAPHAAAFARPVAGPSRTWQDVSAAEFLAEVDAVAKGLVAAGVEPGDRIGLLSRTRYEWSLLDFALWSAGAVVVPIYETSSAEQIEWILADSGAVGLVVEDAGHLATFGSVRERLERVSHLWRIEPSAPEAGDGAIAQLTTAGAEVPDAEIARRRASLNRDSLASILYTSGTTGRPKGCGLTHGNFLDESVQVVAAVGPMLREPDASTLLFLPLAHVLARVIELACVHGRARLAHCGDVKQLVPQLAEVRPTFVLSVPRVFEKVYNSAAQKAHAGGKGQIFEAAAATAISYSRARDTGGPGLGLRLRYALFDRLVYGKIRAALGGRARWAVSGGAPLGERLAHFYRGIGLTVLEGYGLTETTAAVTLNTPGHGRIGTVGRPVPGNSVRIAEDGEILVSGPVVFTSYWNNEKATAEAMEDGWFHTGDIGELDDEGFLKITGRKKELLVTAAGKNVAPAVLEDRVRAHPLVSQCLVVGDAQPYIAALVTIDAEMLAPWKEQHSKPATATVADLLEDPDLLAAVQEAIDEANRAVSRAEAIRRFRLLTTDFTPENGYLTPSMKVKRGLVMKEFATDVAALYQ